MQRFITLAFSALLLLSLNAATPETHYTVIVSLDGFRWDYPDMYKTPNLDRMAARRGKGRDASLLSCLYVSQSLYAGHGIGSRPSRHNQQYFLGCKEQTPVFHGRLRHPQQPGILLGGTDMDNGSETRCKNRQYVLGRLGHCD